MPVKNVTAAYPPTVLIHGTADTDVPFEQSQLIRNAVYEYWRGKNAAKSKPRSSRNGHR